MVVIIRRLCMTLLLPKYIVVDGRHLKVTEDWSIYFPLVQEKVYCAM